MGIYHIWIPDLLNNIRYAADANVFDRYISHGNVTYNSWISCLLRGQVILRNMLVKFLFYFVKKTCPPQL